MAQTRDLSERQFREAALKMGFRPGAFGYWELPAPHERVAVNRYNGGNRRRSQLAYLIAALRSEEARTA